MVPSVAVLVASCGGGSPPEPPQAPDPPPTAAEAPAVDAVTAPQGAVSVVTAAAGAVSVVTAVEEDVPVADTAATKTVPVTATEEAVPVVTAAAGAVSVAETAATATTGAVAVDAEPLTTTNAAVASSTTTAAVVSDSAPAETVPPSITFTELAAVNADESIWESALAVMLEDLKPLRPLVVSFFYITEDQVAADFCLEDSVDGRVIYRHDQRLVDLEPSGWEISVRSGTKFYDDFESCFEHFN